MAGLQASGIGSGLDINGLVSQLVAAERGPFEQRIRRSETKVNTQISAFGQLRGALSELQSSLESIKSETSFRSRKAESTDKTVFTASAAASAASGSYAVEVRELASSQKLSSAAFVGGPTAVVGTGTLTFTIAGNSFQVAIPETANTVQGIRDAINAAPDNSGVQATVIQTTDGARLVLSASRPGAVNAVRVTATGGDGGLAPLVYDPGTLTNLAELSPARDALLRIEGFDVSSSTNSVDSAIGGVTLNLVAAKPGTILSVVVTPDTTQTGEKLREFVNDFNSLLRTVAQLRKFDPATRQAGPLLGDSLLRGIEARLRSEISAPSAVAAPPYDRLTAIGISTAADGQLRIDDTKLGAALTADFDAVGRLFGGGEGVAGRLFRIVDEPIQAGGQLSARTETLQVAKRGLSSDRAALEVRMAAVERRYRTQFTALDSLLSQLQTTGNYLSQQLSPSSRR